MATEFKTNIAPVAVLLLIAGAVIFYALLAPPAERERAIGPVFYERVAFDVSPGSIVPTPTSTLSGVHDLSSIRVDFSPNEIPTQLTDQVRVRRSAAFDDSATFIVSADKEAMTGAFLDFEVLQKEGELRSLLVTVNKTVVFEGVLPLGNQRVTIPLEELSDGTNTIMVSVEPPGPAFWRSSTYILSNARFVSEQFVAEKAEQQQTFSLSAVELDGLVSAKYQAFARLVSEEPGLLAARINDKQVFADTPQANVSVNLDIPVTLLQNTNTLSWSVNKPGAYEIIFSRVVTEYSKSAFKPKSYSFNILRLEISDIESGNYNCKLEASAASDVTETLTLKINSKSADFRMVSGRLSEDICSYVQQGENFVEVYAPGPLALDSLKLTIMGKV